MPHRFSADPEILRSEKRKKILSTNVFENEVLSKLVYRDNAIDYGAGTGYFTEILARYFRRVYAVEAEKKMIQILKEEIDKKGIKNVGIILSDKPLDFDFEIDFILFSDVLHEVDDLEMFLEWSRSSKVVCIIEWKKIPTDFGPPLEERIGMEEMIDKVVKYFKHVVQLDIYPFHYTLVCYNQEDALKQTYDESKNST